MNRILLALLINFWKLLLLFPRPMHKGLAYILGNLIYLMPIKRNKISKKNIDLCFPTLSEMERNRLHKLNVLASAKVIFDSGIAWFWSDKKINRFIHYEIKGLSNLLNEQKNNNGILLFFKHSLHLELDVRLLGMNSEISISDLSLLISQLIKKEVIINQSLTRNRPNNSEVDRLVCDNSKQLACE